VPAGAAPPPQKVSPQTGRSSAEVRALLESAKTRSQRFELAVRHMQKGRVREARVILNQLVGEDPQSRRFRVKLYHAMALELRGDGKLDEAIRELDRAVALDPDAHDVADLLKKVTAERGRGGIFSKIFGR
jgi:Tfp pilus assembly protein PilF